MNLTGRRVLVTGGAGLIGSALVERLAAENDVRIVDDFSNSDPAQVPDGVDVVAGDLTDEAVAAEAVTADLDAVFHLAAADKYVNSAQPRRQFEANHDLTYNVLDAMADADVDRILFTSSSTVYGEAPRPTPEDYAPLEPISVYGATKLSEEALLSVYAHSHDFTVWNLRFANIVGPRFGAGVVPDFVEKLDDDPEPLDAGLPGTNYEIHRLIDTDEWEEAVLIDEAGETLVVMETVGTLPGFCEGDDDIGVHPALDEAPEGLADYHPEDILVGHGESIYEEGATKLAAALGAD